MPISADPFGDGIAEAGVRYDHGASGPCSAGDHRECCPCGYKAEPAVEGPYASLYTGSQVVAACLLIVGSGAATTTQLQATGKVHRTNGLRPAIRAGLLRSGDSKSYNPGPGRPVKIHTVRDWPAMQVWLDRYLGVRRATAPRLRRQDDPRKGVLYAELYLHFIKQFGEGAVKFDLNSWRPEWQSAGALRIEQHSQDGKARLAGTVVLTDLTSPGQLLELIVTWAAHAFVAKSREPLIFVTTGDRMLLASAVDHVRSGVRRLLRERLGLPALKGHRGDSSLEAKSERMLANLFVTHWTSWFPGGVPSESFASGQAYPLLSPTSAIPALTLSTIAGSQDSDRQAVIEQSVAEERPRA